MIEYARNVCGIATATTEEVDQNASDPVVIFMPEIDRAVSRFSSTFFSQLIPTAQNLGGTMRLGLRPTRFQPGSEWSKLRALYGEDPALSSNYEPTPNGAANGTTALSNGTTANGPTTTKAPPSEPLIIQERHRHRYEVNPAYIDLLSQHGLSFVGKDDKGERMEIMELRDHPWYVGVQYHPEYLSRVLRPSKPYLGLIAAASGCLGDITGGRRRGSSVNGMISPAMLANGLDGVSI